RAVGEVRVVAPLGQGGVGERAADADFESHLQPSPQGQLVVYLLGDERVDGVGVVDAGAADHERRRDRVGGDRGDVAGGRGDAEVGERVVDEVAAQVVEAAWEPFRQAGVDGR